MPLLKEHGEFLFHRELRGREARAQRLRACGLALLAPQPLLDAVEVRVHLRGLEVLRKRPSGRVPHLVHPLLQRVARALALRPQPLLALQHLLVSGRSRDRVRVHSGAARAVQPRTLHRHPTPLGSGALGAVRDADPGLASRPVAREASRA